MKLRFYLRGLGTGILVTAMIFCLLPGKKDVMSEEEIKAKALELGMVDSASLTLGDIRNEQDAAPIEAESTEQSEENVESGQQQETELPESGSIESKVPEKSSASAVDDGAVEVLKITIPSGTNSYTVSRLLEEWLLVENAEEFDTYLCENGYSRNIKEGTHEVPVDATWEEIAKIISGN